MAPSRYGGGVSLKIRKNWVREGGGGEWRRKRQEIGSRRSSKNRHIVFGDGKGDNGMVIALNEGTRCWWRDKHHTLPQASRAKHNPKVW